MGVSERSFNLLNRFMNMPVLVETPLGLFSGILRRIQISLHHGVGCLLLETREGWLLVKAWTVIKRRV